MTAPVVNLTPQNANYIVGFCMPGFASASSATVPITSGTPIEVDGNYLIYGAEHACFKLAPNPPATGSHGLKTPPTAITCELTSASVLRGNDDPAIPLGDRVFIANDGRIVFRPNIVAAILDAAKGNLTGITGVQIQAIIKPVYQNPTGATPAYEPTSAIITIKFDGVDFNSFTNTDFIDETPYIHYTDSTTNTPAAVGSGPIMG